MTVSRVDGEIIIKLSSDIKLEEIQRFLNYLRYKEITSKSTANQEDANQLAKNVNQSWWEKNKSRFLPEE